MIFTEHFSLSSGGHMTSAIMINSKKMIQTAMVLFILGSLINVKPVQAVGPIEVTTNVDDFGSDLSFCSLREAVQAVNLGTDFGGCSNPGGTAIHLPANAFSYNLTIAGASELANATGDINILNDLTLSGDGLLSTVIDGAFGDRIFRIANDKIVTIDNVTIQSGTSPGNGGAIYNAGTLSLNFVQVKWSVANANGGGIYSSFDGSSVPYLNLYQTTVSQNHAAVASNHGGGIANNGGHIDLNYSSVISNDSYGDGGGIWSSGGYSTSILNSLIYSNRSVYGSGGNIYNRGPMNIDKSRAYNGTARIDGGNIYTGQTGGGGANMNITDSDISFGFAEYGYGGGIANDGALGLSNVSFYFDAAEKGGALYTMETVSTTTLDHVTMSGNLTGSSGGYAIYNDVPANPVVVNNSILDAWISTACVGAVASTSSYNIDSGTSCSMPAGQHNLSSTDPLLGIFDFHSGTSMTFPLAINSPAVDAANAIGCPVIDQRGVYRPIDGNRDGINGCDIGAYELQLKAYLPAINK
jgi:CSLREA domain-containing protein